MSQQRLDATNCTVLDFRFEVAKDKFDTERFVQAVKRERGGAICNTPNTDIDYHAHMDWAVRKDDVRISISYYDGSMPLEPGEQEPYAEGAMRWLGQFFKNDTAYAFLVAHFAYDPEAMVSRFPLPIKIPVLPDVDTEIDGVSFTLPGKPGGIEGMLIMNGPTQTSIHVRGGARITFNEFDALRFAAELGLFTAKFTVPKRPKEEAKA